MIPAITINGCTSAFASSDYNFLLKTIISKIDIVMLIKNKCQIYLMIVC